MKYYCQTRILLWIKKMENNYFEWQNDYKYPTPDEIVIPEPWIKIKLFLGRKIDEDLPPIRLGFNEPAILADAIPNRALLLIFNEKLLGFMKENSSQKLLQTFPVEIRNGKNSSKIEPYFLVNILNTQDVIDRKKSDLDINTDGEIGSINRLYIKDDFKKNNDFFRLKGYVSLFICSESFVDKINEKGFKGMKFIPIEKMI